MQIDSNPFERIRFRALVGYAILAFIATLLTLFILGKLLPTWFKGNSSPFRGALLIFLLYVSFCLCTLEMLSRTGVSYSRLCGTFPGWRTLGLYSLWALPQVIFAISTFLLLYLPISFFMPEFFQERFIENDTSAISLNSDKHVLANVLIFFTSVFLAPVIEEFFFRGILLTRWTVKWGVSRGIFASSLIFAILHLDPIGAFCFGCVMTVFYIRTQSLFIPMIIHIANNSIPLTWEWLEMLFATPSAPMTIKAFQELWWIGLVGFTIVTPCAIYFWRHYIRGTDWRVPYFRESANTENNVNLRG